MKIIIYNNNFDCLNNTKIIENNIYETCAFVLDTTITLICKA